MSKRNLLLVGIAAMTSILVNINAYGQTAVTSVFASGLRAPVKTIFTPKGNLLVAEAGNGPNTGRISIIDSGGNRRTLIDGLPSGFAPPNNDASGPSALALRGRNLYIVIGGGDATLAGPVPATEIPNPNPSSQFLSSVLTFRLSPQVEDTTQGFTFTSDDQIALLNHGFSKLVDAAGNQVTLEVLINFHNFTFEPRPNFAGNVRTSNPFGIAANGKKLYVVDASQNQVWEVDSNTGESRVVFRFNPKANPLFPFGPPFIDVVPDGVRLIGKSLLLCAASDWLPVSSGRSRN
ncbi:MAG: ScyD/ScyE family protein [Acidobacteriota bacterium]